MSYGDKYLIEWTSKHNIQNSVTISELDYTGGLSSLNAGSDSPVLRKDCEGHFMGTSLSFSIETDQVDGMPEFYTENPRKYKITLRRAGVVEFIGYLVPEQYSDPYVYNPFDIQLEAVDGIGLLKNIDFDMYGQNIEIDIIDHLLKKTGFELPVVIGLDIVSENQMPSYRPPFEYVSVNVNQFYNDKGEPDNCYDVLSKLLGSYGYNIFLSRIKDQWLIYRSIDMLTTYSKYIDANYDSDVSVMSIVDYDNTSIYVNGSLHRSFEKRLHHVFLSSELGRVSTILPDNIFEKAECSRDIYYCTNWSTSGTGVSQCDVSRSDQMPQGVSAYFPPNSNSYSHYLSYYLDHYLQTSSEEWLYKFKLSILSPPKITTKEMEIPFEVVFHKASGGVVYLTANGWSSTQEPLKAKFQMTALQGYFDLPDQEMNVILPVFPDDGYVEFRFYRNQTWETGLDETIGVYQLSFLPNIDAESEVPAFTNLDLSITDPAINKDKIENLIGSAPDYPNKDILFKNVKFDEPGNTALVNFKNIADSGWSSLIEVIADEIASNNRGPIQLLSGTLVGAGVNLFTIFRDKTVTSEPVFFLQDGEWNLYEDELTGTYKEWFPYAQQSFPVIVSDNFSSDNSDPVTSSKVSGGTGSNVTGIDWSGINGKPSVFPPSPHQHVISDVEKLGDMFAYEENGGNPIIRAKLPFVSNYEIAAFSGVGVNLPSIFESIPVGTGLINDNGVLKIDGSVGTGFDESANYNPSGDWNFTGLLKKNGLSVATESWATGQFESKFTKNTAFNKNFAGTGSATTVARSDHNHNAIYHPLGGGSANDFTVKDLTIHGTVNHWIGDVITVDDARLQLNRTQGAATVASGIDVYNGTSVVSSLLYGTDNRWKVGGENIATESWVGLNYLGKTAKAADADKLDGLHGSSFLRSDIETFANAKLNLNTGGEALRFSKKGYMSFFDDLNTTRLSFIGNGSSVNNDLYINSLNYIHVFESGSETLTLKNGKVGINVTEPSFFLDLNSDGFDHLRITRDTFSTEIKQRGVTGGLVFDFTSTTTTPYLELRKAGAAKLKLNTDGISEFNGGGVNVSGNITSDGEVTAYSTSDKRLKKNIKPLASALDLISRYNVVTFNWNDKAKKLNSAKDNRTTYGQIAQELEKVSPELVHPIYDGKYKSIDYPQLININTKGIQELYTIIQDQQQRIQELEKRMN